MNRKNWRNSFWRRKKKRKKLLSAAFSWFGSGSGDSQVEDPLTGGRKRRGGRSQLARFLGGGYDASRMLRKTQRVKDH